MNTFTGAIALITGAGSGIGAALARALARRQAFVVCADIKEDTARQVLDGILREGGSGSAHALDVTDSNAVAALIREVVLQHGKLDLLFNNAGISIAGEARDIALEHWRAVLDVNLMGVVNGVDAGYKQMARQGHGHIINIASLAGLIPFPTNVPYATSKHAVVGMSLSLRAEGADLGVKVSAVCPGFVQTGIFAATPFINVDRERAMRNIPFPPLDSDKAAERILRGITRNEALIVFPAYARLFWRLHRLSAGVLNAFHLKGIRDMRKLRLKQDP
jgi:NAD(P)-dependent dehydrogenase (short-subunit alcohol dehydrogenase family)